MHTYLVVVVVVVVAVRSTFEHGIDRMGFTQRQESDVAMLAVLALHIHTATCASMEIVSLITVHCIPIR